MNALEIHGLTKKRGEFALQGLELTLPAGCIMGLIGENGAGKSTTIRLILNSLGRDGGTIAVYGKDNRALTALEREDIGVVLDEVGLPEYMNAAQIGRMLAGIFRRWQPEVYEGYLRRLGLPEDKAFKDYSRGMRMKLGLAAALSHQPRLLLLDEATSGLDPVVRDEILTIFADFTRDEDHAVLISSHILDELSRLATHYGFIDGGRMVKEMSAGELEARCRKCMRLDVSDTRALARVLDRQKAGYRIVDDTHADLYTELPVTELVLALDKERCAVRSIKERDESLENFYMHLIGGVRHA